MEWDYDADEWPDQNANAQKIEDPEVSRPGWIDEEDFQDTGTGCDKEKGADVGRAHVETA